MIQKYSKKIGRVIVILIASTCLSQVFCATEEQYNEIYKSFSAKHSEEESINLLNKLLAEPRIFNKRGYASANQLLARKYFTAEFLALSHENLETVIKTNSDALKQTLFGKSLILGWSLHNSKDGYDLRELFKIKADVRYGDFYKHAITNSKLAVDVEIVDRLNALNEQEHYNFYFETIHLAWPSKDLKDEQLLAKKRALKLADEQLQEQELREKEELRKKLESEEQRIKSEDLQERMSEWQPEILKQLQTSKALRKAKTLLLFQISDSDPDNYVGYGKALQSCSEAIAKQSGSNEEAIKNSSTILSFLNLLVTEKGKSHACEILATIVGSDNFESIMKNADKLVRTKLKDKIPEANKPTSLRIEDDEKKLDKLQEFLYLDKALICFSNEKNKKTVTDYFHEIIEKKGFDLSKMGEIISKFGNIKNEQEFWIQIQGCAKK